MLTINQTIPEMQFEVFHEETIKKMNFSDFKNTWLIVFFYPADFTFVCPTELEELAESYKKFKKEGAEIVSVSTDTVYVHKAWKDQSEAIAKIQFPMIADPTGKISKAFGVYIEEEGVALRGTFLVNPEKKVKTMEIHDNGIGRSADELLRKLQAAKFVEEHGEVCPAGWRPGKKSLKPGLDLVGKI